MLVTSISVQNVRSFLERQEISLVNGISILIGPNGGGKTNLLDACAVVLRRYLFSSMHAAHRPQRGNDEYYNFEENDTLNNMTLEKHRDGEGLPQILEVTATVTATDLGNMTRIKADADELTKKAAQKYGNLTLNQSADWDLSLIKIGTDYTFKFVDGKLQNETPELNTIRQYLKVFSVDAQIREE